MTFLANLLNGYRPLAGRRWRETEYREVELYDKRKKLAFAQGLEESTFDKALLEKLTAARLAWFALDDFLGARDAALNEGLGSWKRYLALPRQTATDKLVAEVYRTLRILRIATTHAQGHAEMREGVLWLTCNFERCSLSLSITPAGLDLLGSFVGFYLESLDSPYSATYVEWMLGAYFTDIVAEVRKFADEDRVLFQFQQRVAFNRHFRFDCENPRVKRDGNGYLVEIGKMHEDAQRYPIDFYAALDDKLYIVPVEALRERRITAEALPAWQARCADGLTLPASFRHRFARERMVIGQPMT